VGVVKVVIELKTDSQNGIGRVLASLSYVEQGLAEVPA
jgi:hypothetical protein